MKITGHTYSVTIRSQLENVSGSCYRLCGRAPRVPNLRRNIAFCRGPVPQLIAVISTARLSDLLRRSYLLPGAAISGIIALSAVSLAEPQLYYYIPPLMSRGFHKFFEIFLLTMTQGFRPLFSFSERLYIIGMAFLRKAPVFVAPRPTRGALFSKNPTVFLRFPLIFRVLYAL